MNGYRLYSRENKLGKSTYLDYAWKGRRYRVSLGVNLTKDQQQVAALDMMQQIQVGDGVAKSPASVCRTSNSGSIEAPSPTLASVLPTYWSHFALHKRIDRRRNEGIIEHHLLPSFGGGLAGFTPTDGLAYIARRREAGASDATIRREWNTFMAVLNAAVAYDLLDKNRLKVVNPPKGERRTRIATPEEIRLLAERADLDVWRVVVMALMTPLRQGMILGSDSAWLTKLEDGWWAILPPPRSEKKNHPPKVPLNRFAVQALMGYEQRIGKIFTRWQRAESFRHAFERTCLKAGITGLTFHDLKHTSLTWLDKLAIPWNTIQLLGGHRLEGTTERYAHTTPERDRRLRDAVDALADHFEEILGTRLAQTGTGQVYGSAYSKKVTVNVRS
jgi:integrase